MAVVSAIPAYSPNHDAIHVCRSLYSVKSSVSARQVLVNAQTGHMGPGTQVTGNPTYQGLSVE